MTNILKAFGIVFAISLLLFGVLKLLGLANADNAKLALTPFAAVALVYSKLEENSKLLKEQGKLQTFSDFSLPFWRVLLLGAISGFAILEFISGLGASLAVLLARKMTPSANLELTRFVTAALIPVNFYVLFAVGRWIGVRAKDKAFVAAALAGGLCKLADFGVTFAEMSAADYKQFYGFEKANISFLLKTNSIGIFLLGGVCILGCWVGIRHRQAWYLDHLLKSIAPASRLAILDIAHEEAQKTMSVALQLSNTGQR
jgi:hypothetical protein